MELELRQLKRRELYFAIVTMTVTLAVLLAVIFTLAAPASVAQEPPEASAPVLAEPTLPPPAANPYGPTDFQYQGQYLSCTAGKSVLGLDVSEFQKPIDWAQVKAAGFEFVFIRAAWRGYGGGVLNADVRAQEHYEGAKAAGLKVGAYIFSQAITVEEAIEEAEYLMGLVRDWELDMPLVFDWEYVKEDARTGDMDQRTLTDITKAFCDVVRKNGHQPMVYFNWRQSNNLLHMEELVEYPFWLAWYSDSMSYPYKVDFWQYTDTGTVPGVEGNADINIWFQYE